MFFWKDERDLIFISVVSDFYVWAFDKENSKICKLNQ